MEQNETPWILDVKIIDPADSARPAPAFLLPLRSLRGKGEGRGEVRVNYPPATPAYKETKSHLRLDFASPPPHTPHQPDD